MIREHGTTKEAAIETIQAALRAAGYERAVTWTGDRAEARYGPFASLVRATGHVTDERIYLDSCRGLARGPVVRVCRTLLTELFPGGEQREGTPRIDRDG